jgi:hypothetical protein
MEPQSASSFEDGERQMLSRRAVLAWKIINSGWHYLRHGTHFLFRTALVLLLAAIAIEQYRIAGLLEESLYVQAAASEWMNQAAAEHLLKLMEH